jgi:membrane protein implicated in regulation of membrane protease activity
LPASGTNGHVPGRLRPNLATTTAPGQFPGKYLPLSGASWLLVPAPRQPNDGRPKGAQNSGVILLIGIGLAIFVVPDGWGIPVVIVAAILEFFETTATWRWSQRGQARVGPETLIGGSGRAITECRPDGLVRVRGEDWRARCDVGVAPGQPIRVVGREELTLLVEPIT